MHEKYSLVSLLRGVNVGGHHKIRMEDLRSVYESLGFQSVQTYVQSGNVVFTTRQNEPSLLAGQIEAALENRFGFRPDVIIRDAAEMKEVIRRNPFAGRDSIEPSKLAVVFLARDLGPDARTTILRLANGPEELHVTERELYIYFPNGMGRSKLPVAAMEKASKVAGTTRNWNTVTKLAEMASTLV